MPISSKFRRLAAIVLIGIVLCIIAVFVLLQTPPARRFVLQKIQNLADAQGISFDASELDYNLLSFSVTLHNVVIKSKAAPDLPPIAKVDLVKADVSLKQLLKGSYVISDALIQNPSLHLVIDPSGRDNIPKLPASNKTGKTTIILQHLTVSSGSLRAEERRQKIDLNLPLWHIAVNGELATAQHNIQFQIEKPGSIGFEDRSLPITDLSLKALLKETALDIKSFKLSTAQSTLAFSGVINNFNDPRFDIHAETNLSLGALVQFAGINQPIGGDVNVNLTANGPLGQMQVTANLTGKDLSIEGFQGIALNANAKYDAAQRRVHVASLSLNSPGIAIEGDANLALAAQAGLSDLNAKIKSIDLRAVSRTLKLPVQIASRASGEVKAHWPGLTYEKADGSATLHLSATRSTAARDVVPLTGSLTAATHGQNITLQIAHLDSIGASATGRVTLDRRNRLGGELTGDVANLDPLIAGLEAYLGKPPGTLVGTEIGGSAHMNAVLAGTLSQPQFSASLSGSNLSIGQIHDVALAADAAYNPNQIVIGSAAVRWQNQSITGSGTVGLNGKSPALNLALNADNASVAAILSGLGKQGIPVTGTINLAASVKGTLKQPQATLAITASDLSAYGESWGTLSAEAQLANDVIDITHLDLNKAPGQVLRATGFYNLDTKAYRLQTAGNLQFPGLTLPGAIPVRGAIDLSATGEGTVDNPKLVLKLNAGNLTVRGEDVGSIAANINVAGKQANLDVTAPKYKLTATAAVGTSDPYPIQFQLAAKGTDLSKLPLNLNPPLAGTITATVQGSGNIGEWQKGSAAAHVDQLAITWNGQPIRTEGPLDARFANGVLDVQRATILAADSRVSLQGTIPVEPTAPAGELHLQGQLSLAGLDKLIPQDKPVVAQGQVTLDGVLRGSLKHIDPTATITLKDGYFSAPAVSPVSAANASIEVRDGTVLINNLAAQWASAAISANGEIPLGLLPPDLPVDLTRKGGSAKFTATMKGLDLASIKGIPDSVGGTISVRLDAQASKPDLNALTAKLSFDELRLNLAKIPLEQQGTSTITVENGIARVEQFRLTGPDTAVQLSGTAGLNEPRPLDLHVNGNFDAALLAAFTSDVRAQGATTIQLALSGTAVDPKASGFLEMKQGQLSLPSPRIAADNLNVRIDVNGNRLTIARLDGGLNGGTLTGSGGLSYANGEPVDVNLKIQAKDVYLDYPQNLKTVSNGEITLQSQADRYVLGGRINITEGSYTDQLNLDQGLASYLNKSSELDLTQERNPLLQRLHFNIAVRTQNPLVVDNNLAKAELDVNVRIAGTYYDPGLTGRINIEEGGKLNLNERTYLLDRGVITFTSEQRIEPSLDLLARTQAAGYDITLQIQGSPGNLETTFTSDPPLPEPDIIAVLLTGRKVEDLSGHEVDIAKEQVLSYLTGRVGGAIGRSIEQATGLSQVRIEPNLIANESDPTARLTVGQNITRKLNLVYSMNLTDSSDQIYILEYDITKRFQTRGIKQSDNSYRFDFSHMLQFGGTAAPTRTTAEREKRTIGSIGFTGNTIFTGKQLADRLKVKPGKQYDFFKVRKGLDRIDQLYADKGLLEAKIHLNRESKDSVVDLDLNVQPGPHVDFVYEGLNPSSGLRKKVRQIWQAGVFDTQRAEEAVQAIKNALIENDHLRPKVEYSIITPQPATKRVLFDIQPGVKYHDVKLVFSGAGKIEPSDLKRVIKDQKLGTAVYTDPGKVVDLLSRYYREQGYLEAKADQPHYGLNPETRTGTVTIPITEGPLFKTGKLEFTGNHAYDNGQLSADIALKSGEPYKPELRQKSTDKLRELYGAKGYNDAEFQYTLQRNPTAGVVDVTFQIAENQQAVVKDIQIKGTDATSDELVRNQLEIAPGDFLNLQALSRSRRNLYRTGAYSLVDISHSAVDQSGNPQLNQQPVILNVRLREIRPFQLNYGGYYDTDRGPGAIADISNRNSLGEARVLGLRTRYDKNLQEARLYFSQPFLRNFPVRSLGAAYVRREVHEDFNTDRLGFSFEQQVRFKKSYVMNYGYRFEETHTYERVPDPLFDQTLRVAPLTATITRETRNDIFDATRGSFVSHAIEYAPPYLGSELKYAKYFGQFFKYFAFDKPGPIPLQKNVMRSRLVFATAVRVGLAGGIGGQDLIPGRAEAGQIALGERFFAGGGTTIRGFAQDAIGPRIPGTNSPAGGDAILLLNNEMRFPLFSIFDGVGFVDIGNVYRTLGDFNPTDVRKSAGLGLRIRTPYFLIRFDYGFKLDRRPGESRARPFFSIGQAF